MLTDYPDPDLVSNMQYNADLSAGIIPAREDGLRRLHVDGYKWGSDVTKLRAYLPPAADGSPGLFDVLIMADVVYSHREHPNLIKTMRETMKKSPDSVALVIFTPYQPWLLPKTEQFFPLAEASGFTVTKIFQKVLDAVLFENDPGVSLHLKSIISVVLTTCRMRNYAEPCLDIRFGGHQRNWVHPRFNWYPWNDEMII